MSEFLSMGGYGFYVWTAFITVSVVCYILFYRTRKTLKKYEREFAEELDKLPIEHKNKIAKSSKVVSSILASQNKLG